MMPCMVPSIPRKKVASEKLRSYPCLSVPEYSYVFRENVSKDQNKKRGTLSVLISSRFLNANKKKKACLFDICIALQAIKNASKIIPFVYLTVEISAKIHLQLFLEKANGSDG